MKILFVTDVHNSDKMLRNLASLSLRADMLVIGGDITTFGEEAYFVMFMNSISAMNLKIPVLYVPGNNDIPDFQLPNSVHNIDGSTKEFFGYKFGGLGGSPPTPFNTPNEYSESTLAEKLKGIGRVDILVSHPPPYNSPQDTLSSGGHAGSRAVDNYIREVKPKLVLCGHVHEAKAVSVIHGSTVVNPGAAVNGNYAIITLHDKVMVDLLTF